MNKPRRMRAVEHEVRVEGMRKACVVVVGKHEGKRNLRRLRLVG
jgi:hypothetical protein